VQPRPILKTVLPILKLNRGKRRFILLATVEEESASAPADGWKSTLVGKDLFTRNMLTADQIEIAKAVRGPSHHLNA
jgi:hypothetical protein